MVQQRRKGVEGEQELARHFIQEGFVARRGQQHRGGPDAPDVIVDDLPWLHVECKRTEKLNVYDAMVQAMHDCAGQHMPVVCHRRSHRRWLAILSLDDLLAIIRNTPNVGPASQIPGLEVFTEEVEPEEEDAAIAELFEHVKAPGGTTGT